LARLKTSAKPPHSIPLPGPVAEVGLIAYLAPKVTPELLALHAPFFERFSSVARGIWPLYGFATWVPHCTLGIGLLPQQLAPAVEACQAFGLPLACTVAEVGLVEFRPVKQLQAALLSEVIIGWTGR